MTRDEAAAIVSAVCRQYRGTADEHDQIHQALTLLLEPTTVDDDTS